MLVLILSATRATAQAPGAVTELDPGVGIAVELNPHARLDFYTGREKSEEIAGSKWKVSGGASFRVKPMFKRFLDAIDTDKQHLIVVGASYEFSRASEAGEEKVEHKIMLDGTPRYVFPLKILASNRNRFELRWINGDYHWRYRNRLFAERSFKIPFRLKRIEVTPYGGAEAIWDHRYHKWSLFKFTGGVQIPLVRRTSLEFQYERQNCVTCADRSTNIFGITLNVHFRLKRK